MSFHNRVSGTKVKRALGVQAALIVRIHDRGLPATQAELVAEMQDWFADRSDGKKMPDERSIRRKVTPIWRALRREEA